MNCKTMEKSAIKYQNGEMGYFGRRAFEKHARECPACRKKYMAMVAVGILLTASPKMYKPTLMDKVSSAPVLRYIAGGMIVVGTLVAVANIGHNGSSEDRQAGNGSRMRISAPPSNESPQNESRGTATQTAVTGESQNNRGGSGVNNGVFKIKSVSGNKEIEIIVDDDLKMKSRTEK